MKGDNILDNVANEKQEAIKRFWKFVERNKVTTVERHTRLHILLEGCNLDAFREEYNTGIINAKFIDGDLHVEAKWLCASATDKEILAGRTSK